MKKYLLPLLSILLITACQKEITTTKNPEEITGGTSYKPKKFTVCHFDAATGTSMTMEVAQNELSKHLKHGDVQGECSSVTTICSQVWMVKNLDVTTYRNGDVIPEVTDPTAWAALTTGAWCYYENNSANGSTYGKLYNWYAVNDPRGLAPTGWHIPSDAEWTSLSTCLGGDLVAGGKMKSVGSIEAATGLWRDPNVDATNSSGFTALPGGFRADNAEFFDFSTGALWWSSTDWITPLSENFPWHRYIIHLGDRLVPGNADKAYGFSIRCVKD